MLQPIHSLRCGLGCAKFSQQAFCIDCSRCRSELFESRQNDFTLLIRRWQAQSTHNAAAWDFVSGVPRRRSTCTLATVTHEYSDTAGYQRRCVSESLVRDFMFTATLLVLPLTSITKSRAWACQPGHAIIVIKSR